MTTFLLAEVWVLRYHLGNLGRICFPNYALPYILAIPFNVRKFFRALTDSSGVGGGGQVPPSPPTLSLGPALHSPSNFNKFYSVNSYT